MTLDALIFGAHPDDIELTSGGLAALLAAHGHRVGLVDLTRGEGSTRGTVETRAQEAAAAARLLSAHSRRSLALPDMGLNARDHGQLQAVVACLREARPSLVVAPDRHDPHPDHVEGSQLVTRACYLAGLARFDAPGERFRPRRLLYAMYRAAKPPHLVVDISTVWEQRQSALRAHSSQLAPSGPSTYLTSPDFLPGVEGRARAFGALIGVRYGEGYRTHGPLAINDARALLAPPLPGDPR